MTKEKATGLPEATEAQKAAAAKEGVSDALKEVAKDAFIASHDGVQYGEPAEDQRFKGPYEVARFEYILDLPDRDIDEALKVSDDPALTDSQVAGLLEVERSGKNRTNVTQKLLKRLGVKAKDIGLITGAGPAFTNDVTNITDL